MPRDWEEVRITVIRPGLIPTSSPCGNTIPDDDRLTVSLPAGARSASQTHKQTDIYANVNCLLSVFASGLWCLLSLCV